jgi:hypothetical protein|tara:strand:+ start:294 stop:521 length:228 start_codon:yes stop_codon:yes gene_type:complete
MKVSVITVNMESNEMVNGSVGAWTEWLQKSDTKLLPMLHYMAWKITVRGDSFSSIIYGTKWEILEKSYNRWREAD